MANRMRHQITDYERILRDYHKASFRHVVVFEAEISEDDKRHLFCQADLLRQCGNELLGIMKRRLEQLLRTKRYRGLQKYYGSLSEKLKDLEKVKVLSAIQKKHRQELLAELKSAGDSMKEMQEAYQVTWDFCRKTMEHLRLSYGQPSIFALSRAEDVWSAVSKVLYSDGDSLHFRKRGQSIRHTERQQRLILRAMDRSRRATNPGNYNPDGTIRKGKKIWIKSNRYRKLQKKHQELCRIAAENRKLAIHEQVHKMRSLGNIFVTEAKNAKKLQRRAKPEEPLDKNGKPKRKKRFGKSIQNRCPGYFQMKVKQIFESTGGIYIEVPADYRASQYDHTADDYIKKKLSQRMFCLQDGTKVQRDWYSSFLLYCIDLTTKTIDREKCKMEFESLLRKEQVMIEEIIRSGRQVMNSGIRIAQ